MLNFKQIVKKIENTYNFENIPEDWISSTLPNLPSLQETKTILITKNIQISLPILENSEFGDQIKQLRTHFFFDLLPTEFI
jgi:hypothetical protein